MARSVRDQNNVPTEHSWRGYGPFYHNVFNILKRIPLKKYEQFTNISKEEIKKHNKINDLWVIYKNFVYDLTDFVDNHPGGKNNIKSSW